MHTDARLQPLLNSALARGDYADVRLVLAQMTAESVAKYRERCICSDGAPHVFETKYRAGWPAERACVKCGTSAPEPFCRHPLTCCLAGRCAAEFVCND